MYAWLITVDHIEKGLEAGCAGPRGVDPVQLKRLQNGEGKKFRLKDDDGEVYYEGLYLSDGKGDDNGFEPLDDWGMPGAGCTSVEYWENDQWEQL